MSGVVVWDVSPELIKIGPVPVHYYGLLFAIGIIVGYNIVKYIFKRENVAIRYLDSLLVYIVVGTIIGARLGHCFFYDYAYYSQHLLEIIIPFQKIDGSYQFTGFTGLASHGGAIGVLIAIYLFCLKYKVGMFWILDRIALGVPIAGAFIRFGNLMNSEIYGKPTNGAWGVIFVQDDLIPRHPTQVYEAIGYMIAGLILWFMYKKKQAQINGVLFGYFLIFMFFTRFVLEFFKENQVAFEQDMVLNMGQILSIPFILIGLGIVLFQKQLAPFSFYRPTNLVE